MSMRLIPCTRSSSNARQEHRCICHGTAHRIEDLHADLDGPAFRAYYCAAGMQELRAAVNRAAGIAGTATRDYPIN